MDTKYGLSIDRMPGERLRDLKTAEIELRADPGRLERNWIIGRLMSQSGVSDAIWGEAHMPSLVIEYDADIVSSAELVNFLYVCGLSAPVRVER
jgi:hypothetical protein